jgi:cytochrome c
MTRAGVIGLVAAAATLMGASAAMAAAAPAPPPAPAGDAAVGATLFKQRCSVCHSIVDDGKVTPGPLMLGLVGRKPGSAKFTYSPAMKAQGGTWTTARLYQFLEAPGKIVPGTFMVISLPKPDERANVVAYLATLKK